MQANAWWREIACAMFLVKTVHVGSIRQAHILSSLIVSQLKLLRKLLKV
jgi:hypothetical protein